MTLAIVMAVYAVRMLRDNLIEVLDSDYIRMAELKGVPAPRVVLAPCPAQRAGADAERDGAQPRLSHRRRGGGREGVQLSGLRQPARRRAAAARPAGDRGDGDDRGRRLYRRESLSPISRRSSSIRGCGRHDDGRRRSRSASSLPGAGACSGGNAAQLPASAPTILVLHLVIAIVGPFWAPYGFAQMGTGAPLSGMSWAHPFGVDQLGRDVFSRVVHGAHIVILLSLSGTASASWSARSSACSPAMSAAGSTNLIQRLLEALISIPFLVLALIAIASAGPELSGNPVLDRAGRGAGLCAAHRAHGAGRRPSTSPRAIS